MQQLVSGSLIPRSMRVSEPRKVEAGPSVEARVELLWTPRHDRAGAVMDSRILFVRKVDAGIIMRAAVTWAVRMDW